MKFQGFTLLEVIVAIFILTVGAGAVLALISQTLSAASLVEDRLIASYLAQEGIELVRNIRDTNWLAGRAWDSGLTDCQTSPYCQIDYNDGNLSIYTGNPLNIETATGFYGYDSGNPTKFKRKIVITPEGTEKIKVEVNIDWTERGRAHNLKVLEYLTNWKP